MYRHYRLHRKEKYESLKYSLKAIIILIIDEVATVKMGAVSSSETLVPTYKFTRPHNQEYHHGFLHRWENLKSHIVECHSSVAMERS
jgi:hypothetical protein